MSTPRIVNIRQDRIDKLEELAEDGFAPYPSAAHRSHMAGDLVADFDEKQGQTVTVAGRLMSFRAHGGVSFADIQDQSGQIQLFIRKKPMADADPATGNLGYKRLKLLDVGDFVEATGELMRTRRGEISVSVDTLRLLTKTLRPLPEKWAGLKDRERILRQRYLHHTMEPDERAVFERFGRMLFEVRRYLVDRGFIEVHTPILQALYGGGTARPFVTHLKALDQDMYLSISHELYLKRMIAAGFDKVFTIGRYFRNEGIDSTHHPEFSMIETMTAYENYEYNMDLVEGLFKHVARRVYGRTRFEVDGQQVELDQEWRRLDMADGVQERFGVDFRNCPDVQTANSWLAQNGIDEPQPTIGQALFKLFDEKVQPELVQPTFVTGHPIEISPLAKPMADDPRYVERFEVVIGGMECGDNWSEQNDPRRLLETWKAGRDNLPEDERHPLDYGFVEMLEHGMPPTTGIGPGLERMAMIFEETSNIDDVIYFPLMRPETGGVNALIYGEEADPTSQEGAGAEAAEAAEVAPAVSREELDALLADGRISPAAPRVELRPRLSHIAGQSFGTVLVTGLLDEGPLLVTGVVAPGKAAQASLKAATEALATRLREALDDVAVEVGADR